MAAPARIGDGVGKVASSATRRAAAAGLDMRGVGVHVGQHYDNVAGGQRGIGVEAQSSVGEVQGRKV